MLKCRGAFAALQMGWRERPLELSLVKHSRTSPQLSALDSKVNVLDRQDFSLSSVLSSSLPRNRPKSTFTKPDPSCLLGR